MDAPNVIQSFFSAFLDNKWKLMHASYTMLSSIYGKLSDIPLTLYCDYDFKQILEKSHHKEVIELDEFKNPLSYLFIDPMLFAWPKFIALDKVPRDTIHIDCDVFLKDSSCIKLFDREGYDVMCQHKEKLVFSTVNQSYIDSFKSVEHLEFPDFVKKETPQSMPNNGILLIDNERLWNEYRDLYWNMVDKCKADPVRPVGYCCPDLIFEQYFLEQLCFRDNIPIKYAFPQEDFKEIYQCAIENNYQHMCSEKMDNLAKCIEVIKNKDTIAWESLKSNFGNEFPEYFE